MCENHSFYSDQIPGLEIRFSSFRTKTFGKHTHPTYCIGLISDGETKSWHGEKEYVIKKGDIILINPHVVHSCNPQGSTALSYIMLYLEPFLVQELAAAVMGLRDKTVVVRWTDVVVQKDYAVVKLYELCDLVRREVPSLELQNVFYDVTSILLQKHAEISSDRSHSFNNLFPGLENAKILLEEDVSKNFSLQELASKAGLSPYYFLRQFRKVYGLPPHAYQMQLRINAAKKMLLQGIAIVDVAGELGFSDQSHFTRTFRSNVGIPPGKFLGAQESFETDMG